MWLALSSATTPVRLHQELTHTFLLQAAEETLAVIIMNSCGNPVELNIDIHQVIRTNSANFGEICRGH